MEVEIDGQRLTGSTSEAAAAAAVVTVETGEETGRGAGSVTADPPTTPQQQRQHRSADASENDGRGDETGGAQSKKKRCRRKRKAGEHHRVLHRWKPYDEMTWQERQELDERETVRANRKRDRRFASGQPMAPYNTTQFLMEQHDGDDRTPRSVDAAAADAADAPHSGPDLAGGPRPWSGDDDSLSDSPYSGFEESYLQRDFIKAYETYRAERLQGMTKDELVRECLVMEAKLDCLQGTIESLKESTEFVGRLKEENERLKKENELLKIVNRTESREKSAAECV